MAFRDGPTTVKGVVVRREGGGYEVVRPSLAAARGNRGRRGVQYGRGRARNSLFGEHEAATSCSSSSSTSSGNSSGIDDQRHSARDQPRVRLQRPDGAGLCAGEHQIWGRVDLSSSSDAGSLDHVPSERARRTDPLPSNLMKDRPAPASKPSKVGLPSKASKVGLLSHNQTKVWGVGVDPSKLDFKLDSTSSSDNHTPRAHEHGPAPPAPPTPADLLQERFGKRLASLDPILQHDMSLETLRAWDLLDENDAPTSVGSWLHDDGLCTPCLRVGICQFGVECKFCHLPHDKLSTDNLGDNRKKPAAKVRGSVRPCKEKRARRKRLRDILEKQVLDDPHGVDIENMQLPPSFDAEPRAMNLLKERLIKLRQDTLTDATSSTIIHL